MIRLYDKDSFCCAKCSPVFVKFLRTLFFFMALLAFLAVVLLFIWGSYLYVSERGDFGICREFVCLRDDASLEFFFKIAEVGSALLVGWGVFYAAGNYALSIDQESKKSYREHYFFFKEAFEAEVNKRGSLSLSKLDALHWHEFMFSNGRRGLRNTPSPYYWERLNQIKSAFLRMKKKSRDSRTPHYQKYFIDLVSDLGVMMEPTIERKFREVEEDIFGLVDAINSRFAGIEARRMSINLTELLGRYKG